MPENDQSNDGVYDEMRQRIARNQGRTRVDSEDSKFASMRLSISRSVENVGTLLASSLMLWLVAAFTVLFTGTLLFLALQMPSDSPPQVEEITPDANVSGLTRPLVP